MKIRPTPLIASITLLTFLCSAGLSQQSQGGGNDSASDRSIAPRPDPPGLMVNLTAASWNGEFFSYRSGDNFIVIVPQARSEAISWTLSGKGLTALQVEQRGEDVAVVLRVAGGTKPVVEQRQNSLTLVFPAPLTPIAPAGNARSDSSTTAASSPMLPTNGMSNNADATLAVSRAPSSPAPTTHAPLVPTSQGSIQDLASSLLQRNTTADALNLDLAVPESPAFTVLGVTPQTVVRPATPHQFATSLINSLDQNGNFQTGLAIDTAPYMLFNGANVTIRDYMTQPLTRLLARTQFSFAITKGASNDDLSRRLAAGLHFTIWDRGDPRIYRKGEEGDVLDCFVKSLDLTTPVPPDVIGDEEKEAAFLAPILAKLKPAADKCRADGQKARWNRSALSFAYAPSWISKTGGTSDFKWNGGAFWTSLAYGFEEVESLRRIAQLIVHARYRTKEQVPDENNAGAFSTQNSFFVGGRFRAGSPAFAFNFEDAYVKNKISGGKVDSFNRYSVGAELKLTDALYLVFSAGSNSGSSNGNNKGFIMSSFKFGFNKKSQMNPQPQ